MGAALLSGLMAGAMEKPEPSGANRVAVWRREELTPGHTGTGAGVVRVRSFAFAGNHKPDKREKTDNASNEHTPANDIGEYNEKCM